MNVNEFGKLKLREGAGGNYKEGLCVMEAVAWINNENATDRPECACPVLGKFAIGLNDNLNDENRQQLRKLILPMSGTRSKDHEVIRDEYIKLNVARRIVSLAFDKNNLPDYAEAFRNVKSIEELEELSNRASIAAGAEVYDNHNISVSASQITNSAGTAASLAATAIAYVTVDMNVRQEVLLKCIPILEEAIKLGPNSYDMLDSYKLRVKDLAKFVEKELV